MILTCCLFFALIGATAWAFRNRWILNRMLIDQKRAMVAHDHDLLDLFEKQVVAAIGALLWQASEEKFTLHGLNLHNYVIVRNRNKRIMRLCFHPNLSVSVAIEWRDGGSQQTFGYQEIADLYNLLVEQVGQYSAFDAKNGGFGTYTRSGDGGSLAHLALVHRK